MNAREAAVFPATAQVNTGNQTLATVATEKPRFGEIVAIFAIGLSHLTSCEIKGDLEGYFYWRRRKKGLKKKATRCSTSFIILARRAQI